MKYRSRDEITVLILQTCLEPQTKTKIMYKCYLSYTQLVEYMKYVIDKQLVSVSTQNNLYLTNEKGREYLKLSQKITELLQQSIERSEKD